MKIKLNKEERKLINALKKKLGRKKINKLSNARMRIYLAIAKATASHWLIVTLPSVWVVILDWIISLL